MAFDRVRCEAMTQLNELCRVADIKANVVFCGLTTVAAKFDNDLLSVMRMNWFGFEK